MTSINISELISNYILHLDIFDRLYYLRKIKQGKRLFVKNKVQI